MIPNTSGVITSAKPKPKLNRIPLTINANVNAEIPVRNQPAITVTTPEILYTALSLSQAPSAKDVPIATMKVT